MRGLVALCAALCVALSVRAQTTSTTPRTIIPLTPSMRTMGNNLVFNVDANNRVRIQYGEKESDSVYLDDPSQSTIDAIRLGYSIGESINSAKQLADVQAQLRAETQQVKNDLLVFISNTKTELMSLISKTNSDLNTLVAQTKSELNGIIASTKTELLNKIDQNRVTVDTQMDSQSAQISSSISTLTSRVRTVEDLRGPAWAISISNEVSTVKSQFTALDGKVDVVRTIAEAVECGQPFPFRPQLANVTCASTNMNARCDVECDSTRFEVNKVTITCSSNGEWLGLPTCVPRIGLSRETAGLTCREIKERWSAARDGTYWIHANLNPFRVWCDMTLDGGGWTLISTVGSGDTKVGAEGKALPVHGFDVENLVQNRLTGRTGWGDLGENRVNAIHRAYRNSIVKLHAVGPGSYQGQSFYLRKYDDPHCSTFPYDAGRFNLFRAIRNTWLWGVRADRYCGYDIGLNNYDALRHRADNNGGRVGRDAMNWWDHWSVRMGTVGDSLDWQLSYTSRHGIPGDVWGGCEWSFNFATDQNTISYGFCNTDSFSRILIK